MSSGEGGCQHQKDTKGEVSKNKTLHPLQALPVPEAGAKVLGAACGARDLAGSPESGADRPSPLRPPAGAAQEPSPLPQRCSLRPRPRWAAGPVGVPERDGAVSEGRRAGGPRCPAPAGGCQPGSERSAPPVSPRHRLTPCGALPPASSRSPSPSSWASPAVGRTQRLGWSLEPGERRGYGAGGLPWGRWARRTACPQCPGPLHRHGPSPQPSTWIAAPRPPRGARAVPTAGGSVPTAGCRRPGAKRAMLGSAPARDRGIGKIPPASGRAAG